MVEKIQLTDANVIEELINVIPVATNNKNGLYEKSYVVKGFTTGAESSKLIKMFSCKKYGFSGKISVIFRRSESSNISEFHIYSNVYVTVDGISIIEIYRRSGNHSNITFYRDEEYVYAHMTSGYYFIHFKLDFLFIGGVILEEQKGVDISTLTKISFTE